MGSIRLSNVDKFFGLQQVIHDVSLDIADQDFVVFVGPSGCGKSTLLRLISGLEEVTTGTVSIDGRDVTALPPSDRGLAMVFQSYALYPHKTVGENMGFGLKVAGEKKEEIVKRVNDAAEILQLESLLDRKPKALSGGQRQRVAIGRAIVRQPVGFLFDEPLSNLDAALRIQMRIEIAKLHHQLKTTMIYVTHDQVEAMTLADSIVVLRDGRIEQQGHPMDLYRRPANLFVAQFIGSPKMNVLNVGPAAESNGSITVAIPGHGTVKTDMRPPERAGVPAKLGIRPEHLGLVSPESGQLRGTVSVAEYLGGDTFVYVDIPDQETITVRADGEKTVRIGENVGLDIPAGYCHLFDEAGTSLAQG